MAQDPITWQTLATVSGASGASAGLVAFVRVFAGGLSAKTAQMLAAAFGVLLIELAVIVLGAAGVREIVLGLFTGVAAGLAATKLVAAG